MLQERPLVPIRPFECDMEQACVHQSRERNVQFRALQCSVNGVKWGVTFIWRVYDVHCNTIQVQALVNLLQAADMAT